MKFPSLLILIEWIMCCSIFITLAFFQIYYLIPFIVSSTCYYFLYRNKVDFVDKYILSIVSFFSSGYFLGLSAGTYSTLMLIPFILFFLIHAIHQHSSAFKCPSCKKLIFFNPINAFGIWFYTMGFPEKCSRCGQILR